eukprot:gb/GFBE01079687.1/.p1 GENE.gb/GFBE01079687.1/~~gb/GFBE01079687.1/.p1  ORF type:complete len:327 (+),score=62.44 gb/GFBE01079687.1/:1-981(+)
MEVTIGIKFQETQLQIPLLLNRWTKQSHFLSDVYKVIDSYGTADHMRQWHGRLAGMRLDVIMEEKRQAKLRMKAAPSVKEHAPAAASRGATSASPSIISRVSRMGLGVRRMFVSMGPRPQHRAQSAPSSAMRTQTRSTPVPTSATPSLAQVAPAHVPDDSGNQLRCQTPAPFARAVSDGAVLQTSRRSSLDQGRHSDRSEEQQAMSSMPGVEDSLAQGRQLRSTLDEAEQDERRLQGITEKSSERPAASSPEELPGQQRNLREEQPVTSSMPGFAGSIEDSSASGSQLRAMEDAAEQTERRLQGIAEKSSEHPAAPPLEELPGLVV